MTTRDNIIVVRRLNGTYNYSNILSSTWLYARVSLNYVAGSSRNLGAYIPQYYCYFHLELLSDDDVPNTCTALIRNAFAFRQVVREQLISRFGRVRGGRVGRRTVYNRRRPSEMRFWSRLPLYALGLFNSLSFHPLRPSVPRISPCFRPRPRSAWRQKAHSAATACGFIAVYRRRLRSIIRSTEAASCVLNLSLTKLVLPVAAVVASNRPRRRRNYKITFLVQCIHNIRTPYLYVRTCTRHACRRRLSSRVVWPNRFST